MRRPTKRDERGIVGIILTIVIVWALIAVVLLTRTLEAAQSIDTRVKDIRGSITSADTHLNTGCNQNGASNCSTALPILSTTQGIVVQIDAAAKPLTGQAGQILDAANSINSTVTQILKTATDINGVVHSIHDTAFGIGATVNGINGNINGINSDVVDIKAGVARINQRVDVILGLAAPIKADTGAITNLAGGILVQAQGICNDSVSSIVLPILPGLLRIC